MTYRFSTVSTRHKVNRGNFSKQRHIWHVTHYCTLTLLTQVHFCPPAAMHTGFSSFFFSFLLTFPSSPSRYMGPPLSGKCEGGVFPHFSPAPAAPFRSRTQGVSWFVFFSLSFSFHTFLLSHPLLLGPSSRIAPSPLVPCRPCHASPLATCRPHRVAPCHASPSPRVPFVVSPSLSSYHGLCTSLNQWICGGYGGGGWVGWKCKGRL